MFLKVILNLLNLVIFLNIYSFYNDFALNIEILLLFIFIFIVLNLFIFLYNILNDFIVLKKDEVLKEYYSSLFDLFNILSIYKQKLFFFKKILLKLYNFIKFIVFFFRIKYIIGFLKLKNYFFYILNNILSNNFIYSLFIKKKLYNFFFNIKKDLFHLNKFYSNIFLIEEDSNFSIFFSYIKK